MNHYPHHIGDYVKATVHLSPDEDLCYRRLLDMYYDTESPIPLETQSVSRRLRMGSEVVETVLKEFFISRSDGWHSLRCDMEIREYHARAEKNRVNGKRGGRPKKTQSVILGNPTLSQNNLNQNQNQNQLNPSAQFAEFWIAYPKKKNKGDAEKAWKVISPGTDLIAKIMDALLHAKQSKDWAKESGKYIPYPATWLRAKGWDDEYDVPQGKRLVV
jgi:uncharacterized protein YdaU (DUF1376 family)